MISIRRRLTYFLCLAIGVLLIATGSGVFLAMRGLLRWQFDETLTAKARAIITASEIDGGDFEIDLTVQDFAGFGPGGDDYFEIRRTGGDLFLKSPSLEASGQSITRAEVFLPPPDEQAGIFAGKLGDQRAARFYVQKFQPKDDKKERFQDLYLIAASPTRGMSKQLALLAVVLAVAGLAALLVTVPIVRTGLRNGLKPLHRLSRDVDAIRPENLDQRLATDSLPVELAPVATGLNEWLTRLEASFARERQFTSHAAHELRTPLAELRSLAELGATWREEATSERCREIVTVADELQALLDKLALLARADAGQQPVSRETIHLEDSVHAALSRVREEADAKGLTINSRVSPGPFETDPVLWSAILQNLLANSVAYAPENSEIRLSASASGLLLANAAPSLSPDDLESVFKRFWRKDASRTGYGHSGLGMSIVQSCVELLGGKVEARINPDGDFEVRVDWPD